MRFLSLSLSFSHTHTRVDIVYRFIFSGTCMHAICLSPVMLISMPRTHAIYLSLNIDMCHTNSFSLLARCACVARNIKMHLYEKIILWEKRMKEGMPYLQMWIWVWVSFCKISIVYFLSVRYKSDGLYCRMAGTPSSPTLFFIRVEICECHFPPHTPTHPHFPTPKE